MAARDFARAPRGASGMKAGAFRPPASRGHALEPALRARAETRFGWNFADVRLHADDEAATRAGAAAFTSGRDIVFAPGQWQPGAARGEALLSHELAHVVQQARGEAPGASPAATPVLEAEANAASVQPARAVTCAAPPGVMQLQTPGDEPPVSAGELQSLTDILRLATTERAGDAPQGLEIGALGTYAKGVANPHPAAVQSNPGGAGGPAGRAPQTGRADAGVYLEHQTPAAVAREILANYLYFGPKGQKRGGRDIREALTIVFGVGSKPIKDRLDQSLHDEIKARKAAGGDVPLIEAITRGAQHSQEATAGPDWENTAGQITKLFLAEQEQFFSPRFGHQEFRPAETQTGPGPLKGVSDHELDLHLDRMFDPYVKPFASASPADVAPLVAAGGTAAPEPVAAPEPETAPAPEPEPVIAPVAPKRSSEAIARAPAAAREGGFIDPGFGAKPGAPVPEREALPPVPEHEAAPGPEGRAGAIASGIAKGANDAAAALRAYDTFDDARAHGQGRLSAALSAGRTYLEGTNVVMGAAANFRAKKAAGQDSIEAAISTAGETAGALLSPGGAAAHLVGAAANLVQAGDEHLNRGKPHDAARPKFSVGDGAALVGQVIPAAMAAQTVGAGARAYYDIGRAIGGDTSAVERFGHDAASGVLGPVLQPIGMAADIVGNLGSGQELGHAVDETLKAGQNSLLGRAGDALGDATFKGVTAASEAAERIRKKARALLSW